MAGRSPTRQMPAGHLPGASAHPAQHDLARLPRFHQVEALLELVRRQLLAEHLAQREAVAHELGHLVPCLVHAQAIAAVDVQGIEDDPVTINDLALGQTARQGICHARQLTQLSTTLPDIPDSIRSKPFCNSSAGSWWLRTWPSGKPSSTSWVILYQVSYMRRP